MGQEINFLRPNFPRNIITVLIFSFQMFLGNLVCMSCLILYSWRLSKHVRILSFLFTFFCIYVFVVLPHIRTSVMFILLYENRGHGFSSAAHACGSWHTAHDAVRSYSRESGDRNVRFQKEKKKEKPNEEKYTFWVSNFPSNQIEKRFLFEYYSYFDRF